MHGPCAGSSGSRAGPAARLSCNGTCSALQRRLQHAWLQLGYLPRKQAAVKQLQRSAHRLRNAKHAVQESKHN